MVRSEAIGSVVIKDTGKSTADGTLMAGERYDIRLVALDSRWHPVAAGSNSTANFKINSFTGATVGPDGNYTAVNQIEFLPLRPLILEQLMMVKPML